MTKISVEEYKERLARRLIEEVVQIPGLPRPMDRAEQAAGVVWPFARCGPLAALGADARRNGGLRPLRRADDLGYGLDPNANQRADAFFYKHATRPSGLPTPAAAHWKRLSTSSARREPTVWRTRTYSRRPSPQGRWKAGPVTALRELGRPFEVLLDAKAKGRLRHEHEISHQTRKVAPPRLADGEAWRHLPHYDGNVTADIPITATVLVNRCLTGQPSMGRNTPS